MNRQSDVEKWAALYVRLSRDDENEGDSNSISHQIDNDLTPFRNIMNEWYAKDTSKKIRSVFYNKGMSGQRLCTQIPYGYIKGTDGNLSIDEETAPVVKTIFDLCAEGNGTGWIARTLRERRIPTPGTIEFRRTGRTRNCHPNDSFRWSDSSVAKILAQDAYLGRTTNFKTTKLSYKSKKTVDNPPEKWVTFENTHEAIIDIDTWDTVQKARQQRRRPTKLGDMGMFSGMIYCADCGQKLYLCRISTWRHEQEYYNCSTYRCHRGCSPHYVRATVLEELVLQNLQRVMSYAQEDEKQFVQTLLDEKNAMRSKEREKAKRQLSKHERRIAEIDGIVQKLYEDNYSGKLTDERFAKLSEGYEQEQAELKATVEKLRADVDDAEEQAKDIERFTKIVRKYLYPTELTPSLLHSLVDKIIVHEREKTDGKSTQKVEILYSFVGANEFSPEYHEK